MPKGASRIPQASEVMQPVRALRLLLVALAVAVVLLGADGFRIDLAGRSVTSLDHRHAQWPRLSAPNSRVYLSAAPSVIYSDVQSNKSAAASELSEGIRLIGASSTVGVTAAAAVLLAKSAISLLDHKIDHRYPLLSPLIGSIIVSLCYSAEGNTGKPSLKCYPEESMFYGVCVKHVLWRYLALIASVGCGCSVGMAGPAAELGTALAFLLSQTALKQYSVHHLNGLLLAGAAAGIAANLNAPLTGCLFAWQVSRRTLQSPLGDDRPEEERELKIQQGMLATAVLAASVVVRKGKLFQMSQALELPKILLATPGVDLVTFGVLALLCGALSAQYVTLRAALQQQFKKVDKRMRPLLGGLVNSFAVALGMSQAASHGVGAFNELLAGELSFLQTLRFTGVKFLASTSSAASGLVGEWMIAAGGGPFTSSLLIGAGVGAMYHTLLQTYFPSLRTTPLVPYVLAGAASMLSSYFNASFMASVFMVELTHRPELSLVALYCTLLSAWTSQAIKQLKAKKISH